MWVVFIGAAVVTRKNSHIAVELLSNVMLPGPARSVLLALIDSSSSASSDCSPISR